AAYKDSHRRPPVGLGAQAFFPIQEQAQECRFEKEREHAFHGQSLPDYTAGIAREVGPVGAELKFHGNSSYHTNHEVDPEYACPESRSFVVNLVLASQAQGLENHDQWCQSHGELREKIVKSDGESEVQAVNQECAIHICQFPQKQQDRKLKRMARFCDVTHITQRELSSAMSFGGPFPGAEIHGAFPHLRNAAAAHPFQE